jgi:hypothetical protein
LKARRIVTLLLDRKSATAKRMVRHSSDGHAGDVIAVGRCLA